MKINFFSFFPSNVYLFTRQWQLGVTLDILQAQIDSLSREVQRYTYRKAKVSLVLFTFLIFGPPPLSAAMR